LVNQAERYKKRKLRVRFRGRSRGDEYLKDDCIIYWYVPIQSTMLDFKRDELIAAGFSVYDPSYLRGETEYKE